MLGDTLSRASHASTNMLEALEVNFKFISEGYKSDKFYEPIVRFLEGKGNIERVSAQKNQNLAENFRLDGVNIYIYLGKICVPRAAVSKVLSMAHDAKTAGHFGFLKTMSRLKKYYWKHKARDVKNYIQGCLICQQKKDYIRKETFRSI